MRMEDNQLIRREMATTAPRKNPDDASHTHREHRGLANKPQITIDMCDDEDDFDDEEDRDEDEETRSLSPTPRYIEYGEISRSRSMSNVYSLSSDGARSPLGVGREQSPNRLSVDLTPVLRPGTRSETSIYDICKMMKSPPQHRRLLSENIGTNIRTTDAIFPYKYDSIAKTRSLPPIRPSSPTGGRRRPSPLGSGSSSPPESERSSPIGSPVPQRKARLPRTLDPLPDAVRSKSTGSLSQPGAPKDKNGETDGRMLKSDTLYVTTSPFLPVGTYAADR